MNLRTILAIGIAALIVTTGAAAALPGNAPAEAGPEETRTSADGDAGPPGDLPGPVPGFVSEIHDAINGFLNGSLDGSLGEAVSDIASDADPSGESQG